MSEFREKLKMCKCVISVIVAEELQRYSFVVHFFIDQKRSHTCTSFVETHATALLNEFPVEYVKYS